MFRVSRFRLAPTAGGRFVDALISAHSSTLSAITLKDLKAAVAPAFLNTASAVLEFNKACYYPQTFLLLRRLPKALPKVCEGRGLRGIGEETKEVRNTNETGFYTVHPLC